MGRTPTQSIMLVGRENVGKTQLVSQLTGRTAIPGNFRGSTISIDRYRDNDREWVDSPGIVRSSDTETTAVAVRALGDADTVVLVAQATSLQDDLQEMWSLVQGRRGIVVVTFWDKIADPNQSRAALQAMSVESGVPFEPVNATRIGETEKQRLVGLIDKRAQFGARPSQPVSWSFQQPAPSWLDHRFIGPLIFLALLLTPAAGTIFVANRFAEVCHPLVAQLIEPLITNAEAIRPAWLAAVLVSKEADNGYGLLNMGPFLLVWALPTVICFGLLGGIYKATGLMARIDDALDPLVRSIGLSGRDVVRVMLGFGCNVPAVVSTRACSSCSRGTAVAAIAFGAMCSYQLPATLAVLSAGAKATGTHPLLMTLMFMGYMLVTTLVYLRLTAPRTARNPLNILVNTQKPFLQWPTLAGVWLELKSSLYQFSFQALPVFCLICIVASTLTYFGVLGWITAGVAPLMAAFNLPAAAAWPVVLASIRKDGIFLLTSSLTGTTPTTTAQVLTGVYLAGVLFPCLVTCLQIGRELGPLKALRLIAQQASFAIGFSLILAWGAAWFLPLCGI
jgi:ferrous iron transport protein B